MNQLLKFLFATLLFSFFTACSVSTDDDEPSIVLKDIDVTTITDSSSITLTWEKLEDVSWYRIYIAKEGEELQEETTYQDLNNDPISYKLRNLEANTVYDLKMEGTDYAIGGDVLAEWESTVTTEE